MATKARHRATALLNGRQPNGDKPPQPNGDEPPPPRYVPTNATVNSAAAKTRAGERHCKRRSNPQRGSPPPEKEANPPAIKVEKPQAQARHELQRDRPRPCGNN